MINFRCPKCNDWLSVPDSQSGAKETCPTCGNVCLVPVATTSSVIDAAGRQSRVSSAPRLRKPERPDVVKLGLALYIAAFVLGVINGVIAHEPEMDKEMLATLLGLGCISLLLVPADILGLVMACLGRAWGAILMICTTALDFLLWAAMAAAAPSLVFSPIAILSTISSITSLVCFILPSAWGYYADSGAYRRNRRERY